MKQIKRKSLAELMQDRANKTNNTSVYKEVEVPETQNSSTWDKVKQNAENIQKNTVQQKSELQKARINNSNNNALLKGFTNNTNTQPITNSISTWDRVKSKANDILNDTAKIGSNFALGAKSSAKNVLYYTQSMSEKNSEDYKKHNQFIGRINEEQKGLEEKLQSKNTNINNEIKSVVDLRKQNLILNDKNKILLSQKPSESYMLKSIDDSIKKDEEKIQENIENSNTRLGKKVAELTPSIAQSTTGMALGAINPALGVSYFQTSAGGNYTRDAKAKGMNDDQAVLYGTIMGAMESATESVGAKLTTGVGKAFFKNGAKEGLKAFGLDIAENFFEEAIMEPIQESVMQATGGKADWDNMAQRMWESGVNGALTSIIMGGASAGIGKATQLISKMENGQQISQAEIADTLKEINKSEEVDIEKMLYQNFQFTAQDIIKNTDVQKNVETKLENMAGEISQLEAKEFQRKEINTIIDQSNLDESIKENLRNISEKYNLNSKEVENTIQNTIDGKYEQNQQATIENKEVLNKGKQITQEQNEIAQNEMSEQIKQDSKNFAKQIDDYISGSIRSSDFINVGSTPKILQDIGLSDSQIILKQSKLKMMLQDSSNSNDNLHGLPVETVKRIPEAISNPLNVLKSSTDENSIVVITDLADKMERPIIASIEMDYKGQIGNIEFLTNRLTSAYGKNNYDSFMQNEIGKGNLLYDIDEGIIKELPTSTRLQLPEGLSSTVDASTTNNSISQNEKNMQVQENKTYQNLDNDILTEDKVKKMVLLSKEQREKYQNSLKNKENQIIKEPRVPEAKYKGVPKVEKNIDNVYNSNESESGINGERRRNSTNGIQEGSLGGKEENTFSADRFKQEEKSIRSKGEIVYTEKDRNFYNKLKEKYNKTVFIFDDNNTSFGGGVSVIDNETILFGRNALDNYGYDFLEGHEILEDIYKNHKDISKEKINYLIEKLQADQKFGTAFLNYIADMDEGVYQYYIDKPELVAKEIIGDLNGLRNQGFDYMQLDAFKELDSNLINEIQNTILELESEIYKKNSNKSSFFKEENITDEVYREEISDGKTRKHYKSVFESEQVGELGKKAAKELYKTDTYTPISNLETIIQASDDISRNGEENTYIAFRNKLRTKEKIELKDIATGETLIQIYSQKGDYAKVNDLIQDVAILGTELGQQVQALSLIKKATPEGQLQYLNKLVDRTNLKEKANLKVTNEMAEKILKSRNQEELENNLTEVAVELGSQLPITTKDKIRSWRYLCMLGNPKTHIKNIGANIAMNLTQNLKNKVAGGIEDVVGIINPNIERTKTLKFANEEQKSFAKQDAEYMKDLIDSGGKYDIKNAIENNKKQFDNKKLNNIAEFNSNTLDVEDKIFLKLAYKQALQNYMAANKLKASGMKGATLEKARQYASIQAQEATFHQFNALANNLNEIENRGGLLGKTFEAILPFKKTPLNIAKSGIEYSPIGLFNSLTSDVAKIIKGTKEYKQQLAEGKITQEQYKSETSKLVTKQIDNMSKGLTGTAIGVLGYFLASAGIIKAGNEGEDDEFEEKLGDQEYSIKIGDNTYTLDWISPSAIPLFTGATVYQLANGESKDKEELLNSSMTGLAKAFEPMTEMSMLQGLTSAISSYDQDGSSKIFDLIASGTTSYLGQFVPTALGQVSRTIDPYERDTSTTKKGIEGKVDRFAKQTINKLPVASFVLPVKKDVWGQDKKRNENVLLRGLENAILPFNRKELIEDRTNKELLNVFESSGEKVLPGVPDKDLTINKEKYRLTAKEYNTAKQTFGTTSKSLLDKLFKSKSYISLKPDGRAKAIQDVYSYAKEKIKVDYAKSINQKVETSKMYNTVSKLEKQKGNVSAYFEFKGKIEDLDRQKGDDERVKQKEKIKYLSQMNIDDKTKRIIYEDSLASEEEIEKIKDISISNYLEYKNNLSSATDKKRIEKKDDDVELNSTEKINLIKDKSYSNRDKKLIYENFIGTNDNTYNVISKLENGNTNINAYLDYKIQDIKSEEDTKSNIVGKKVSKGDGTSKSKTLNYILNSNMTDLEKAYIIETKYSNTLDVNTREQLKSLVEKTFTDKKELEEVVEKFKDLEKHKDDGKWYWKK